MNITRRMTENLPPISEENLRKESEKYVRQRDLLNERGGAAPQPALRSLGPNRLHHSTSFLFEEVLVPREPV
jgi:hypothetical protein